METWHACQEDLYLYAHISHVFVAAGYSLQAMLQCSIPCTIARTPARSSVQDRERSVSCLLESRLCKLICTVVWMNEMHVMQIAFDYCRPGAAENGALLSHVMKRPQHSWMQTVYWSLSKSCDCH